MSGDVTVAKQHEEKYLHQTHNLARNYNVTFSSRVTSTSSSVSGRLSGRNEPQGSISVAVLSFRSATRPCGPHRPRRARARQKRNECRTYHGISYAPRVIEFVLEHLDGVLDGLHLADEPLERQVVGELDVGPARPGNENVE